MADEERSMGIRLAFRKEGQFVNCYMAKDDTMEGATLLGSVRISAIEANSDLFSAFKDFMRSVLEFQIKTLFNITPEWGGERKAPEHERAGEA